MVGNHMVGNHMVGNRNDVVELFDPEEDGPKIIP